MIKKNLVLDMGNILISFDTERTLREHGVTDREDVDLFRKTIFSSDVWSEYDRGTVEKTAFLPLIESLPPRLAEIADDLILKHIFAKENMPPIPATEELVRKAKQKGYKIYLLSNAGQDFYIYSKGIPALSLFDGTFVSSDYLLLKPEREIYEAFFKAFSLLPQECVFVDDMQCNIDGAKDCGMDGVCFNASKEDISSLYSALKEKGIDLT